MNEVIRKMAESLKAGATMLPYNCPVCNSPLFKLKDRTFCVKCGSSQTSTPEGSTAPDSSQFDSVKAIVPQITSTILTRLKKLEVDFNGTSDPERLSKLSELIFRLLSILESLERLGKS